mmetsp:Transcript_109656/g.194465  ORF Transcript_109656/g.194465 Transcript_109656/m.194465 type:complete len:108 (-) Transcript_109656:127-450(-)
MGVQIWLVAAGVGLMVHAGFTMMAEKKRLLGLPSDDSINPQVFLQVLLGAALALWGGIGDFKPIRIRDTRKPRWESLHARPDFHTFTNRAKIIGPLIHGLVTAPPQD